MIKIYIQHGKNLIEHHIKYKELHGYDKTILITRSEHKTLHNRLRREGMCNISSNELNHISQVAYQRIHKETAKLRSKKYYFKHQKEKIKYNKNNIKKKILFYMKPEKGVYIQVRLQYNLNTEHIGIYLSFYS